MNEIKIREGKVSLDGQEVKAITAFKIKSTTEDGYAEVELTLLAKLTWKGGKKMRPRRYPYSGKKKESNAILNITIDSKRLASVSNLKFCHMRRQLFGQ